VGDPKTKTGWDLFESICSSNTNYAQKQNKCDMSGETNHIIQCFVVHKSPFIVITTSNVKYEHVRVCIWGFLWVCPLCYSLWE